MKIKFGYLALLFGALTFLVMAGAPQIVDTVGEDRSVGQVIGENARDLLEAMASEDGKSVKRKDRNSQLNALLDILSFIFFALTVVFALISFSKNEKYILGIGAIVLGAIGLAFYFSYMVMGLAGVILIALAVLVIAGGLDLSF